MDSFEVVGLIFLMACLSVAQVAIGLKSLKILKWVEKRSRDILTTIHSVSEIDEKTDRILHAVNKRNNHEDKIKEPPKSKGTLKNKA